MKNLSIFEPQIEKHYAYKKKHVLYLNLQRSIGPPLNIRSNWSLFDLKLNAILKPLVEAHTRNEINGQAQLTDPNLSKISQI